MKRQTLCGACAHIQRATPAPRAAQVRASPPPEAGALSVTCPVRRAVAIRIPVANPGAAPLALRASYSSPALVGPSKVAIPPGGGGGGDGVTGDGAGGGFECYFAPLVVGESEGTIRLVGEEAGAWRASRVFLLIAAGRSAPTRCSSATHVRAAAPPPPAAQASTGGACA